MRINSVALARSTWVVNISDINDDGIALGRLHRALVDRYGFLNYPAPGPDAFNGTKPATYLGGEFNFQGKPLAISLTVYHDGLAAESATSTEVSDAFLQDLSSWLVSTFGFREPRDFLRRTLYRSELNLTSDISLANAGEPIREFTKVLRQYTGNQTEEPWALLFEPDLLPSSFTFERRANVPFSEKQYFSSAALPTPKHIELLQRFEKIFT